MQTRPTQSEIQYGWIKEMRYQPDFGRYEAAVTLHIDEPGRGTHDVDVLTSVAAYDGESEDALKRRLVLDAARLLRLTESKRVQPEPRPLAA